MDDKYKAVYDSYNKAHAKRKEQFNKYKEKDDWYHEQINKQIKKPKVRLKPDPATVEAELQLEEELWAS